MKNPFIFSPKKVWKGSLIAISYFFLAACMQYEESLSPRDHEATHEITTEANLGVSPLVKKTFTAHLKSENELPLGSIQLPGQGEAIFQLSEDGRSLHYKLIVANIEDVTQAHIHCGGADESGSVVVFLFGLVPTGVNVNGVLATGTITQASIRNTSPLSTCPELQTFDQLIERLRNGTAYVNVHTLINRGGEIRGQIK